MRKVHNQVKDTPTFIEKCVQENLAGKPQPVTQQENLTRMANEILDNDIGVAMDNRNLIKTPKHRPVWVKSFANEMGRLSQRVGGRL